MAAAFFCRVRAHNEKQKKRSHIYYNAFYQHAHSINTPHHSTIFVLKPFEGGACARTNARRCLRVAAAAEWLKSTHFPPGAHANNARSRVARAVCYFFSRVFSPYAHADKYICIQINGVP